MLLTYVIVTMSINIVSKFLLADIYCLKMLSLAVQDANYLP